MCVFLIVPSSYEKSRHSLDRQQTRKNVKRTETSVPVVPKQRGFALFVSADIIGKHNIISNDFVQKRTFISRTCTYTLLLLNILIINEKLLQITFKIPPNWTKRSVMRATGLLRKHHSVVGDTAISVLKVAGITSPRGA